MRKVEWRNPNKMQIDTGHKTFDRTVLALTTGNVLDPGYTGKYIRPMFETECNGLQFRVGHLREADLKWFLDPHRVGKIVQEWPNDTLIVYELKSYNGEQRTIHGYIVTTPGPEYRLLRKVYTGPTYRSRGVVDVSAEYVSNE